MMEQMAIPREAYTGKAAQLFDFLAHVRGGFGVGIGRQRAGGN